MKAEVSPPEQGSSSSEGFGLGPRSIKRPLVLLLIAPILLTLVTTAWAFWAVHAAGGDRGASLRPTPIGLTVGTLVAGIVEESIWRGYAIRRFAARWPLGLAIVVSTLLFGLLHWGLGWEGIVVTSLNGLLLAILFVWRRTLLSPALAHAAVNALVLWF